MTSAAVTAHPDGLTVAEVARRLGGTVEGDTVEGDGSHLLMDVRGLEEAGPEHLSFLSNRRYARHLADSRAGAVLLDADTDRQGRTAIRVGDPYVAFARALAIFHPYQRPEPGVDPRAAIADDATLGEGVTVDAFACVGPGATVGDGTWIEAGAFVGAGATVGAECRLMPHSVVMADSVLGDRVWLNPGAVVGGEGFGFAPRPEGHVKIPQAGRAVVEDDVELGANTCVDRATMGETRVGRGSKLDNLVQIGHGAQLDEGALLAAYAAVAGSARLGRGVILAGKAGVINHRKLGDGVQIGAGSIAMADHRAGEQLAGTPAIDRSTWLRASAAFRRLPDLLKRLRQLEKRVAELEGAELDDEAGPP